ncbi:MAG: hypothetical protein CVU39_16890 [Chloroflexi bacterium HGW-Chloroflexi-10]|nr:MAG: hypothetical protein CVU39_16890 [Chloroflexi bacterium HGW-Chloroflexi-10]
MKKIARLKFNFDPYLLFVLCIAVLVLLPFLNPEQVVRGHDTEVHLARIVGFVETIKTGQIPAKVYTNMLNGMGYGWGIFYPPLSVMIPAIPLGLGFDLANSYKLFLLFCTVFSGLFMYQFVFDISGSRLQAALTSIFYLASPYFLTDLIMRGAVGEQLIFVFLPLIFRGTYSLLYGNQKKYLLIAVGFGGLALSHVIGLALVVLLMAVFLLLNIKKILNRTVFAKLIFAAILAIFSSASFLVPLFENIISTDYWVENQTHAEDNFLYAVYPSQILGSTFTTFWAQPLGNLDEMPQSIGLISSLIILSGLLVLPKLRVQPNGFFYFSIFIILVLSVWMCTIFFPWQKLSWLVFIQFPWRILGIASFASSILAAWILIMLMDKMDANILLIIFTIISIVYISPFLDFGSTEEGVYFKPYYRNYDWHSYLENEAWGYNRTFIGGGEYYPAKLYVTNIRERGTDIKVLEGSTDIDAVIRGSKLSFRFKNNQNAVLELPFAYYVGYQAKITASNGVIYKVIPTESIIGMVSIPINGIKEGTVEVVYRGSLIGQTSFWLSFVTWFGILGLSIKLRRSGSA